MLRVPSSGVKSLEGEAAGWVTGDRAVIGGHGRDTTVVNGDRDAAGVHGPLSPSDPEPRVFFFFSNRLGCLGSILVSVVGTLIVIFLVNLLLR